MFKQRYKTRVRQRLIYFRIGIFGVALGFIVFVTSLGMSIYGFPTYRPALLLISSGSLCTLFFSRVGWSQTPILDLLLNRISILITITGLGIFLLDLVSGSLGILMTLAGILLISLGMYLHSPIPLEEMLEADPNWLQDQ